MVENCFAVSVFCICAAVLGVLLKQYCSEQSLLLLIGSSVTVIIAALNYFLPMLTDIEDIFYSAGLDVSCTSLIFKAAAVCILTRITAEICRDSGESALASAAELWGRGALTFISLPLMKNLTELLCSYL